MAEAVRVDQPTGIDTAPRAPAEHLVALEYAAGGQALEVPDLRGYRVLDQAGQPVACVKTLLVNPVSGRAHAAILTNRKNQRFSIPLDFLDPDPAPRQVRGRFPAQRLEHVRQSEVGGR